MITNTPRTDACPHCGARKLDYTNYICGTTYNIESRGNLCLEREKSQKLEAEVERLHAFIKKCLELLDCDLPTMSTKRLFDEYESQYGKLK